MGHPIYHLELVVSDCRGDVSLNGFPVMSITSASGVPVTFVPPINPYLCGARNTVEVTIHPAIRPGGAATTFGEASLRGNVRRFEAGGIVAPETGDLVVEFGIDEELRDRVREEELELPVSFTVPFASEAIDFSAELLDGSTFDDRDALLDYALRLRDLLAARDAAALAAEMAPKAVVWSQAYGRPVEDYTDGLRDALQEIVAGRMAAFEREDVELTSCCGGRVWRLARKEGQPLLLTSFPDKSNRRLPVYVAPRDGALRIVR